MVRVAAGEEAALGALYDRFTNRVYSLARQMCGHDATADDITQDVFLEVWRRSARFVPDGGSVATWLLTLTHQKAVEAVRREAALCRHNRPADFGWQVPSGPDADQAATDTVDAKHLREALAQLPPPVRQTLALAYYGCYTQSEVATILDIPLGTVKSHSLSALAHLREQLPQFQ